MAQTVDLTYALSLPPQEAIAYFQKKGYTISWNWRDVWQEAHSNAFTVAKAMRLDILQAIRNEVERAIIDGVPFEDFRKNLEPVLKTLGWWGYILEKNPKTGQMERVLAGTPWRLATIFRTNIQSAYMAGRYKQQRESIQERPYWQYVAVLDSRTRPKHRALHGKVFRADDPVWDKIYPPNGFNCRCRVRALTLAEVARKGLQVSSGERLEGMPDEGFAYTPGAWEPDLSKYTEDIAKLWNIPKGVLGNVPVETLD